MPQGPKKLAKDAEVQHLEEAARTGGPTRTTGDKFWFATHLILLVSCAVIYYLILAHVIPLPAERMQIAQRFIRGAAFIIIVLAISGAISVYAINRIKDASTRFTLKRIKRLLVFFLVLIIAISIFF